MYTLRDIQTANLALLVEVDRVCRENDITYYLSEGTLLGAIRHRGSIPWDDDVDISMPREDYEKFACVAPGALGEGFAFWRAGELGENAFFDFVPHVALIDSQVRSADEREGFYGGRLNHVLLDIFILDDASDDDGQQAKLVRDLKYVYGLSWAHRYRIDYSSYTPAQRVMVFGLSRLGKFHSQSGLDERYDKTSQRFRDADTGRLFLSNTLVYELDRIYRKEWFERTIEVEYEGRSFPAPVGFDAILTQLYGDYRQLPPEEDRHSDHYDLTCADFHIGERGLGRVHGA